MLAKRLLCAIIGHRWMSTFSVHDPTGGPWGEEWTKRSGSQCMRCGVTTNEIH